MVIRWYLGEDGELFDFVFLLIRERSIDEGFGPYAILDPQATMWDAIDLDTGAPDLVTPFFGVGNWEVL